MNRRIPQCAKLSVSGMTCQACVSTIESHLLQLEGVEEATAVVFNNAAEIYFDPDKITLEEVCDEFVNIGFGCEVVYSGVNSHCRELAAKDESKTLQTKTLQGKKERGSPTQGNTLQNMQGNAEHQIFQKEFQMSPPLPAEPKFRRSAPDPTYKPAKQKEKDETAIDGSSDESTRASVCGSSLSPDQEECTHRLRISVSQWESKHGEGEKEALNQPDIDQVYDDVEEGHVQVGTPSRFPSRAQMKKAVDAIVTEKGVQSCVLNRRSAYDEPPSLSIIYNPHYVGARYFPLVVEDALPGYRVTASSADTETPTMERELWELQHTLLACIIPAIIVSALAMCPHDRLPSFFKWDIIPGISICALVMLVLVTPIHFIAGWRFHSHAWKTIRKGFFTMDLLISLSTNVTYFYSCVSLIYGFFQSMPGQGLLMQEHGEAGFSMGAYSQIPHFFETPAVVITAVLLGKTIEAHVRLFSTRAINKAAIMSTSSCWISRDSAKELLRYVAAAPQYDSQDPRYGFIQIPSCLLQINDLVLVFPGEAIPSDGILRGGPAMVDESVATGESAPVTKQRNETLLGGSIPIEQPIEYTVTEVGSSTFLGTIQHMVEVANRKKSPVQLLADRISKSFIPFVLILASATAITWTMLILFAVHFQSLAEDAVYPTFARIVFVAQFPIAVIAIACPCALGLATPTAVALATGCASQFGILIKNVDVLEEGSRRFTDVVFDKTGTLTTGGLKPSSVFVDVKPLKDYLPTRANKPHGMKLTARMSSEGIQHGIRGTELAKHNEFAGYEDFSVLMVLWACCSLQLKSQHPIGTSLVNFARRILEAGAFEGSLPTLTDPTNFQSFPGMGVRGIVDLGDFLTWFGDRFYESPNVDVVIGTLAYCTEVMHATATNTTTETCLANFEDEKMHGITYVYVLFDGEFVGRIGLTDTPKESAHELVHEFKHKHGARVWMCTGDNPEAAAGIAEQVGIDPDFIKCQMLPHEKAEFIQVLMGSNHDNQDAKKPARVMMVGDGINDAACLSSATLGVAMGVKATLTTSAADVVLIRSDLWDLIGFLELSKSTIWTIYMNFSWAFAFNLIGLPIAAGIFYPTVMIPPAIAGGLMALSSVTVVLNSMRLTFFKPRTSWRRMLPGSGSNVGQVNSELVKYEQLHVV